MPVGRGAGHAPARRQTPKATPSHRERQLGAYVAPEVVAHIMSDGRVPLRSGVRVPVTVLFADLRGFTRLSGRLAPEHVVAILDDYFDAVTAVAQGAGAMIDKLIGDAVMLVFGVPTARADDAARAVRTAVAMQHAFRALPARWRHRHGALRIGLAVGAASGEAVLANVGSAARMDYTLIGRPVNLASRLTAAARAGEVLISAPLYAAARAGAADLDAGPARRLELKGFRGRVAAHAVRIGSPAAPPRGTATAEDPVCGMKLARRDAWSLVHARRRYFFCSPACRNAFRRAPDRYAGAPGRDSAPGGRL